MARLVVSCMALAAALCSADAPWPVQTFKTEHFVTPVLSTKTFGEVAPGMLFISPNLQGGNGTAPTIMRPDGQLVWRPAEDRNTYNVDTQVLNGQAVLTYWSGQHDAKGYGCGFGGVHILDDTYTQIHHICGDKLNINPLMKLGEPCLLDTHESRITSRGTLLATARSVIPADLSAFGGPKNGWVLDSLFFELDIPSEKVLMRWSTWEHRHQFPFSKIAHYPLDTKHPNKGLPFGTSPDWPWDFAHMNAVADVPSPGAGYIVSCRYFWSAIMVDMQGDVQWYLEGSTGGDFDLPESGNFSYQHDIIATDVTHDSMKLHMFDNANNGGTHPRRPSAGLLLNLNLVNRTVQTIQRFLPRNTTESTRTGGYQALQWKSHALVDFGHPPILNEFDGNGNVVWEASVADLSSTTYRAYKKAWKGYPKTSPKAMAQHAAPMTKIWASWNGATEVDRWEIHGRRNSNESVRFLETLPNAGFETLLELEGRYSQVQVRGIQSNGTLLGVSDMVSVQHSAASSLSSPSSLLALVVGVMVVALV